MGNIKIEAATEDKVVFTTSNMSSVDLLELGQISFVKDKMLIGQALFQVCQESGYSWIFSRDDQPIAFYGWRNMFSDLLRGLVHPKDGLIGISCSGMSENVLEALAYGVVHNVL